MSQTDLQHRIDRLADHEMSANELTELLTDLEERNEWKRCALTLIESSEVKTTLRLMVGETQPHPVISSPAPVSRKYKTPLLIACLTAMAFVAGRTSTGDAAQKIASSGEPNIVEQQDLAKKPDAPTTPPSSTAGPLAIVGYAQVVVQSGVSPRYPVISGDFTERDLLRLTAIPDHVRRQARNRGIEVERVPRVMTVQLSDGQTLAVPMDALGMRQAKVEVL